MRQSLKTLKTGILKRLNTPLTIQIGTVLALVALCFIPAYNTQILNNKNIAYAIARGTGATLKYLLPILFIPTLRMIHAQAFKVIEQFPNIPMIHMIFHDRYTFHKILGITIIGAAAVHTLAHIVNFSVGFLALESLTGLSMIAFILLPITAMYMLRTYQWQFSEVWRKSSYYRQFLIPHQLGWWGLVAVFAVHTSDLRLLSWSLGVAGLFSLDRIWEWVASKNLKVKNITKVHDKMLVIEVEKPISYNYQAGDKAYLSYPAGSAFFNNVHPFTLASSPEENVLRFVISDVGKWSHKLIQNLNMSSTIRVSLSFPSPLRTLHKNPNPHRLLISSGSGLAVTLAHLHEQNSNIRIKIIHATREPKEIDFLNQYIKKHKFNIDLIEFYDTGDGAKQDIQNEDKLTSSRIFAHRFDPTQSKTLTAFKGDVFFCGNDRLGNAVETCIVKDPTTKLHREKFSI